MKLPTDHSIFQNAWVVDDIETACMHWVKLFNVGPFFLAEYSSEQLEDIIYRGQPSEMHMNVAIAQAGPLQIELIQPLGDKPSPYRDTVAEGETKFHHVCVWTDDMDSDLELYLARDCPIAVTGRVKEAGRFAYVDSHAQLNCMLEILEHNEMVEDIFKMIADTCASWDGKNPIRGYD